MTNIPEIPRRTQTIEAFKAGGGRVAAVFPYRYPREVLRAHGFLPVEVWGPPGIDDTPAGDHFQAYTCAIVRNGLSFILAGGLAPADVIVVPNDCDSLQGLGSVLLDFVRPAVPVVPFYPPRGSRASDLSYLIWETRALGDAIGRVSGTRPAHDVLELCTAREEEADGLLARVHRERERIGVPDRELYRLIRSREYLPAERFADLARAALDRTSDGPRPGVPLLLSGIVPEPWALFDALREMGARVAADDMACCGRRLFPAGTATDPWRRIAQRLLDAPPDSMRGAPIRARIDHLGRLARSSGAKGVVFYDVKSCEPEQFDIPALRDGLREMGLPSISMEVDLSGELPRQTVTRLEAFVEMVR
jgi:benzoyl-CoA reductase/2-hydroxyglutaryl-CoA dehydratase subunit BcrC/BadD/HgdB